MRLKADGHLSKKPDPAAAHSTQGCKDSRFLMPHNVFPAPKWPCAVRLLLYFQAIDIGPAVALRPSIQTLKI